MSKLTEQELLNQAVELFGNVYEETVDKKVEKEIFEKISEIEGIHEYLRDLMSDDLKRYWAASNPMQQLHIKGEFARAMRWRGLLKASDGAVVSKSKQFMRSKRHE